MATITNISFNQYSKDDGMICDKCGAYIRNVYTVKYSNGYIAHYGIDCFSKLRKQANLTSFANKLLSKTLKSIKYYCSIIDLWKTINTEEEADNQNLLSTFKTYECWEGRTFEEYKKWQLEEFLLYRLQEEQKTLKKFRNINFEI